MKVFYKQVQLNPTTETDYTDLVNKPSINGVELEGDLSTEQIKVTWYGTQEEFDALPSHDPYTFYIIDDGTPVGTQDSYLDLADKPSINGQVLTGNKLPSDLDMYSRPDVDNLLASMRSIKVVATKPAAPAANTMYYVGPDSESNYHVYLYDALLNEIDLGMAMNQLYREGTAIDIDSANTISVKVDDETIKTNANNELYVKKLDTTLTKGANTANAVKAVWVENGDVKEHTVSSGGKAKPVYVDSGTIKPISETVGSNASNTFKPVYLNAGTITAVSQTVGANTANALKPVYANAGTITALSNSSGGTAKPVYVDAGAIKPISETVGSNASNTFKPVYLKSGTITAVSQTVGANTANALKPVYANAGTITALSNSSGGTAKPVYVDAGAIKPISDNVGATNRPVYLNAGTITQTSTPESGSWYKGVPLVSNSGVTEIGNYLDFHNTNTSTKDYNVRLYADMNAQTGLAIMGVKDDGTDLTGGYIPVVTNNWEDVGSAIQPVYVNNGAITKAQSLFSTDGATSIPKNSNLNTPAFTACGEYVCGGNADAVTLTNCPSTLAFRMFVENAVGNYTGSLSDVSGWVSRTRIIENYAGEKWVQGIEKHGAADTTITYGTWRKVLTDSNVKFKEVTGVTAGTGISATGWSARYNDSFVTINCWSTSTSANIGADTTIFTLPSDQKAYGGGVLVGIKNGSTVVIPCQIYSDNRAIQTKVAIPSGTTIYGQLTFNKS